MWMNSVRSQETVSPGQPTSEFYLEGPDDGDSGLVDVDIYAP
jgi:hypothetical protein